VRGVLANRAGGAAFACSCAAQGLFGAPHSCAVQHEWGCFPKPAPFARTTNLPHSPAFQHPIRMLTLSAVEGSALHPARIVILRESSDRRSPRLPAAARATKGLPRLNLRLSTADCELPTVYFRPHQCCDIYTLTIFLGRDTVHPAHSQWTAPDQSESSRANLGLTPLECALARQPVGRGYTTLLVSADTRPPRICTFYGT
jgi:hypothetical protein